MEADQMLRGLKNKRLFGVAVGLAVCFWLIALSTAQSYVTAQDYNQDREFEQIAELLRLSEGSRVADVGAGGGTWTFKLAKRVGEKGQVLSTEVKEELIKAIKTSVERRGLRNVTVIEGNQDEMGLPPNCCQAVLLRLVYHAFKQSAKMREGLEKAVSPEGLVLIIDFAPKVEQLSKEMAEAGFESVQVIKNWRDQDSVYAVVFRRLKEK
jgi:ubiquinone/menaquinone biosynthesis C-methylase UbiE